MQPTRRADHLPFVAGTLRVFWSPYTMGACA